MDLGLNGKVAMVAGASRGLGYAVARALAGEGVNVSIAARSESSITDAALRIHNDTGSRTLATAVDVKSADSIASWHARTVKELDGVDLLFVNAGGPPAGQTLSFDDGAWVNAFELLVLSAIRMVRLAVPSMKTRGGGAIVDVTSIGLKRDPEALSTSMLDATPSRTKITSRTMGRTICRRARARSWFSQRPLQPM